MGKFDQVVSEGRKQAAEKKNQIKQADGEKQETKKAERAAAEKWLNEVVQPVVVEANDDLKGQKLGIQWKPGQGEHPSVELDFAHTDTPLGRPTGKSIGLSIFPGGRVHAYLDGGDMQELGTITQVGWDKVEDLIIERLHRICADE
jgi:hypothetical protein